LPRDFINLDDLPDVDEYETCPTCGEYLDAGCICKELGYLE
jgi:ribosomal protein L32